MLESFASATLALTLLLASSQSTASAREWDSDYGRARAHAQTVRKPLLVVVDRPTDVQYRIEPVRLVKERPTAQNSELLAAYELCHVDASTPYGMQVAKVFKAEKLPYMAILDNTGRKIIYQHSGALSASEWQAALAAHQRGEIPPAKQSVPASYSYFPQPLGFYGSSDCPSCQRGW